MQEESTLREIEGLLEEARVLKAKGDIKGSLNLVRRIIWVSFSSVLSSIGIDAPYDSILSLYHLIPIGMRPPIGERELEHFEQEYRLALYSDQPLNSEFMEASLDIAERAFHWASSMMRMKPRK
ncbi:MAG: hypothetical protein BA066_00320 [Candidatus Korarchaeota archaeon NZ13-K]|nr:MAG: hypothetical protein BA066_00320 [Candidatus Korarchaeota archaeon NZ13-K]